MSLSTLFSPNTYNINSKSHTLNNLPSNPTNLNNTIWSNNAHNPPHLMFGSTDLSNGGGGGGDKGEKGDKGEAGTNGLKGEVGSNGLKGDTGSGDKGLKGDAGLDGLKGDIGSNGLKGNPGNDGLKGETGSGDKGQKGDAGLDGSNGLKGETGIGIKGDQGSKGDVGIKGDSGSGSVVGIAWTPVITNSSVSANATLNSVSGYYTKNGDIITAGAVFSVNLTSASSGNSTVTFTTSIPVAAVSTFITKPAVVIISSGVAFSQATGSVKLYIIPTPTTARTFNIYASSTGLDVAIGNLYYINVIMQYTTL
ncbi:collagen-like protein [Zamilon virus]|uniref:Collagen-like protein n=1 Tax=Zamilon virus TaxID=1411887 RepID=A0A2P1EHI7_9VIRU|nr:collagen-like protein [Zamilon virus]